jgi:hypothetical protein
MSLKNNMKLLNGLKNKILIIFLVLIIIALSLVIIFFRQSETDDFLEKNYNFSTEYQDLIKLDHPQFNQKISSPLLIQGQARGTWFFEASFPIYLKSLDGQLLGQGLATAEGDWMTENFVRFTAELNFDKGNFDQALLILKKDNPSGLLEFEDRFIVPVDL